MVGGVPLVFGVGQYTVFQHVEWLAEKNVVDALIHRGIKFKRIERALLAVGWCFGDGVGIPKQGLDGLDLPGFGGRVETAGENGRRIVSDFLTLCHHHPYLAKIVATDNHGGGSLGNAGLGYEQVARQRSQQKAQRIGWYKVRIRSSSQNRRWQHRWAFLPFWQLPGAIFSYAATIMNAIK
jgi:hypothetical protein